METTHKKFQAHYRYISHVIDFLTAFQDGRRILEETSPNSIDKLLRSLRIILSLLLKQNLIIQRIQSIKKVQKIQKAQMIQKVQKVQMVQKAQNLGGRLRRKIKKLTTVL